MYTPLEQFIEYKAETGMQCGSYSLEVPPLQEGQQYRFHFDATRCIGCRACEVACNEQNNNPADIKWRRVGEMEGGAFPAVMQLFNSMSCNHCIDPACLKGCPTESYIKIEATGIVVHDDEACIGCQYCTWNCPYGVPVYHEERHIVTKCHMCHKRLDEGQSPACVQACPAGAIEIEAVDIDTWLQGDIDKQGNIPFNVDARVTNSTTRYTLPATMPEQLKEADEHHLKPAHSELPLVFMTVLTQISLGGYFGLVLFELFSFFGGQGPDWTLALLVMLPAALGLPLSALHLGRPFKAMAAMKNIKSSWLSREALALGMFTLMMTVTVALYFFDASVPIRFVFGMMTLGTGIYGIHAQAMIYRIEARPSWNRPTTNVKFFATAYAGVYLLACGALFSEMPLAAAALLGLGVVLAAVQGIVTFKDKAALCDEGIYSYQLQRSLRLYDELFSNHLKLRWVTFAAGALLLPLLTMFLLVAGMHTVALLSMVSAMVLIAVSELSDRFLFYCTAVPLQMAGAFFAGKQRH